MKHDLKILPEYYKEQKLGKKTFEIRKDDRDYNVGDILNLEEFDGKKYTGNKRKRVVTYIMDGGNYGLEKGFVIMSTKKYYLYFLTVVVWRLLIAIYIPVIIILAVTYMPIKWLITGKYLLNKKEQPVLYKLGRKIFG